VTGAAPGDHFHDVYSVQFFRNHTEEPHFSQTKLVGRAMALVLMPRSVADVGCGVGAMLLGISETMASLGREVRCVGIESAIGLGRMREGGSLRIPEDWVVPFDLRDPGLPAGVLDRGRFDLAISAEVAEHLPPDCAGQHLDALCSLSDTVALSAAFVGQGGDQHINERPASYWAGLMGARGYRLDVTATRSAIDMFKDETTRAWGYAKNLRLYRKREGGR